MQSNGYLLPANGATNHAHARSGDGRGSDEKAKPTNRVRLNGNIVRRKPGKRIREYWDIDLPGFGLRVNPGGRRTWFVLFRQRGKLRRVSLGTSRDISPATARRLARAKLAEVALDGLPTRKKARVAQKSDAPLLRDYAERFWADYSRHWKPSTRKRNESAIFKEILGAFGDRRVDELAKGDILFWRDSFVERPGVFNRTLPVFSVMMGYAERLGLRPRGSNPCKGTPRYKRKPMERFLANHEYARLATALRDYEAEQPLYVAAIRLLIFTGARCGEIEQLRWEWVQEPRLMLPDSKTGAKIIYLNRQAIDLIAALPNREPTGLLFPSFRNPDKPISLGIHWSKIRNRAALPDVRLHDLRHSFASVAIRDNISLMVIGKLLGHALAETTTRYAHLSEEIVADAAERVSGSIARLIGAGQ